VIPSRQVVVPEVLEVQELPSVEVRIVPDFPTAKNDGDSVVVWLSELEELSDEFVVV